MDKNSWINEALEGAERDKKMILVDFMWLVRAWLKGRKGYERELAGMFFIMLEAMDSFDENKHDPDEKIFDWQRAIKIFQELERTDPTRYHLSYREGREIYKKEVGELS